jgi:sialate O-acetylesterase
MVLLPRAVRRAALSSALVLLGAATLRAAPARNVRVSKLFTDHMVLQRDVPIRIWGKADGPGTVGVTLARAKAEASVRDGKWTAELPAMAAGGPHTLAIRGANTVTIRDVMVGEVWIASGQSNMKMTVTACLGKKGAGSAADLPGVRLLKLDETCRYEEQDEIASGGWKPFSRGSVSSFSAVAYFFAVEVHRHAKVPVGVIGSYWDGSPAQAWMSRGALAGDPDFAEHVRKLERDMAKAAKPSGLGKYQRNVPSGLYNGMIRPLAPYGVRGVIWYQGESNALGSTPSHHPKQYEKLFPALIRNWRDVFGREIAFYYVQLSTHRTRQKEPLNKYDKISYFPQLRDAQTRTLSVPNTGMAVSIDIGSPSGNIHPKNKKDVGKRLALIARAKLYGERDLVYSGPVYRSHRAAGGKIEIEFDHAGGGLVGRGGPLEGFVVAGGDRKFVWAQARIVGKDKVQVWADAVPQPKAVRYAWHSNPLWSLKNREGLPASPFRTDDWKK